MCPLPPCWEPLWPGKPIPHVLYAPARSQAACQNHPALKAYTEVTSTQNQFWYNNTERNYTEKAGEPWKLSRDCVNSQGLEGLISTIVTSPSTSIGWVRTLSRCSGYLPTRLLQQVPGHIIQMNFGPKHRKQGQSTGHYYVHLPSSPGDVLAR